MIHPTCSEVLATIQTGFEEQIVPHLQDMEARSAAATIAHLLRHVALRIEHEGQVLLDDIARLETLLGRIAQWFEQTGAADAAVVRSAIECTVPEGTYPSLALLGERALLLRKTLVAAQEVLHAQPRDQAACAELRQEIRGYIGAHLADEAILIAPAFQGRGPRR